MIKIKENILKIQVATYLLQLIPVVLTQALIRIFHISDLRLIAGLGPSLQMVHAILYNGIIFNQFIGTAGMITIITLWSYQESSVKKFELIHKIIKYTCAISSLLFLICVLLGNSIFSHFKIPYLVWPVARLYFLVGMINAGLLSWQLVLDGALLSQGKQKITLLNTAILSIGNLVTDFLCVRAFQVGVFSQKTAAVLFAVGTTLWLILGLFISYKILKFPSKNCRLDGNFIPNLNMEWRNEIAIAVVRSLSPLCFAYQIGAIAALSNFLVTYQASLHLAFVGALPLQGGLPIAVRDCSKEIASHKSFLFGTRVLEFIFLSLAPCIFFLLILIPFGVPVINFIFQIEIPLLQEKFVPLFFMGCIFGQLGHALSVPLRANLHNKLITACLVISDLLINNVGIWVLQRITTVTPYILGLLTLCYTFAFLVLIGACLMRKNRRQRDQCKLV